MRVLPCGDAALLVEVDTLAEVLGLSAALRADLPAGVAEIVPAARTVLLRCRPEMSSLAEIAEAIRRLSPRPVDPPAAGRVEIPMRYDGDDLADVAELTGLPKGEIVRRHIRTSWTVAFCGFAPGFGYLVADSDAGWPEISRRDSPRSRVPAGSVALGGQFCGVYPRESPGGWQLIGRTDLRVFDAARNPPALLRPGVGVRFVAAA
jgi:KipI family sensor histidine kinase inhibitor